MHGQIEPNAFQSYMPNITSLFEIVQFKSNNICLCSRLTLGLINMLIIVFFSGISHKIVADSPIRQVSQDRESVTRCESKVKYLCKTKYFSLSEYRWMMKLLFQSVTDSHSDESITLICESVTWICKSVMQILYVCMYVCMLALLFRF